MPQINLLKQQSEKNQDFWVTFMSVLVKIFTFVLLLVIAYYAYLFIRIKSKTSQVEQLQNQIAQEQKDIASISDRDELFTRQQQLKQLMTLVNAHPYWSSLLPALASATLKNASYLSFQAVQDGTISLSVAVPNMEELDKFLQVFDLPQFYNNFYDIRVGSIAKTQVGTQLLTRFDLQMKYNPALLQQQATSTTP